MKYTGQNPLGENDRGNWTLNDGTPLSDDQWNEFQKWHQKGAPGIKSGDPKGGEADESGFWGGVKQVGRGLARGAASDVPFNTVDPEADKSALETGARWVGEFGPLLIPGLDLGAGAKVASWLTSPTAVNALTKVVGSVPKARAALQALAGTAPAVTKGAVGGAMMDPQHPVKGAAEGAVAGPVARATSAGARAVGRAMPSWAKAGAAAAGGGALGSAMYSAGGHGHGYYPWYHAAYGLTPALPALAAAAMGNPAFAGGMAARTLQGDDDDSGKP